METHDESRDPSGCRDHENLRITIGGAVDRVQVTLRVLGADLDPDAVTRLLGMAPSDAARTGIVRPGEHGGSLTVKRGYWHLSTAAEPAPGSLEPMILSMLARLPAAPATWRRLHAMGKVELFCGLFLDYWIRECTLSPRVLKELADRDLPLRLDIYGP